MVAVVDLMLFDSNLLVSSRSRHNIQEPGE
jgi:hypothetical protein